MKDMFRLWDCTWFGRGFLLRSGLRPPPEGTSPQAVAHGRLHRRPSRDTNSACVEASRPGRSRGKGAR